LNTVQLLKEAQIEVMLTFHLQTFSPAAYTIVSINLYLLLESWSLKFDGFLSFDIKFKQVHKNPPVKPDFST